ncbi:MAG: ADP-glyceromanno-heptose 6-epimerase [Spirochaetes bacterium]|nr:ADP-glyceromanno-heptose 6-epimerase [Spirochaetota bacterium]
MIIVTGGAGFIGSAFVWKLNNEGIDDILIVDELGKSEKWKNLIGRKFVDYVNKDEFLNNLSDSSYSDVEAVIHMGACTSTTETDADYMMQNNYRYTKELARWAVMKNARFVYASSAATYGDGSQGFSDNEDTISDLKPLNVYGYSKHLFDIWAIKNKISDKVAGLKFFNVFGPNEYHKEDMVSVVYKAFHQIIDSGKVTLFKSYLDDYKHGEQMRDFIYVKDVVNVIYWFMQNKDVNGIYNLGTGKARKWADLVKAIFSGMGIDPKVDFIDMPQNLREKYQYFTQAEMEKLKQAGYPLEFMSLEEAVRDYVLGYLLKRKYL